MRLTIKEFSSKVGVDGPSATGFFKSMLKLGLAQDDGEGPKPARGRTPRVYKIDDSIAERVAKLNQDSRPETGNTNEVSSPEG